MTSVSKSYWIIDVFADSPLLGNAAAVFFDSDDLSAEKMQAIAREMNLSETVFLTRSEQSTADAAVRIFTPRAELSFAGHPMIAAAYALFHSRSNRSDKASPKTTFTIECAAGEIDVVLRVKEDKQIYMVRQIVPRYWPLNLERHECANMLSLEVNEIAPTPCEIVSTGVRWLLIPVSSIELISGIGPDQAAIENISTKLDVDGVIAFAYQTEPPLVRLRTFAPRRGISEDPVCGSGNGSVGAYLFHHQLMSRDVRLEYIAEQGIEIGRPGRVYVEIGKECGTIAVNVGGTAFRSCQGMLTF